MPFEQVGHGRTLSGAECDVKWSYPCFVTRDRFDAGI